LIHDGVTLPMRRSFRTHELHPARTRGFTPGWYAWPRWGRDYMPRVHGPVWAFFAPTGRRIPAKGETLDRATPREPCPTHSRVLKERRISGIAPKP
jgi:hypothetical protein